MSQLQLLMCIDLFGSGVAFLIINGCATSRLLGDIQKRILELNKFNYTCDIFRKTDGNLILRNTIPFNTIGFANSITIRFFNYNYYPTKSDNCCVFDDSTKTKYEQIIILT